MVPIPPGVFAERVRELDGAAFAAFVAALWAARGFAVERDGPRIEARRDGQRTTLLAVAGDGDPTGNDGGKPTGNQDDGVATSSDDEGEPPERRDDGVADPSQDGDGTVRDDEASPSQDADGPVRDGEASARDDENHETDRGAVDAIVAADPEGVGPGGPAVEVVGPAELRRMALYGVGPADREALFSEHLGRGPTADGDATPDGSDDGRPGRTVVPDRHVGSSPGRERSESGDLPPSGRDRPGTSDSGSWRPGGLENGAGSGGGSDGENDGPTSGRGTRSLLVAAGVIVLAGVVVGGVLAAGGPAGGLPGADGTTPTPTPVGGQGSSIPTDPGSETPTTGATPTSAPPAALANLSAEDYPPGVSAAGVDDPVVLGAVHQETITGSSYRMVLVYREYDGDGLQGYRRETVRVAAPTVYRIDVEIAGEFVGSNTDFGGTERYADGSFTFYYTEGPGGPTYSRRSARATWGSQSARGGRYVGWLGDVENSWIADTFSRDGRRYFWIKLSGGGSGDGGTTESSSVTGAMLVDDRGVVHELRRRRPVGGEPGVTEEFVIRYERFGNVTVEPPYWYDEARNDTDTSGVG